MDTKKLELYWNDIPEKKENALSYAQLTIMWGMCERHVRRILHDLSRFDNGDNFILIRSGQNKGFYKTDNINEITNYKKEIMNKGKSLFGSITKINRVLNTNSEQFDLQNNMRIIRELRELKQSEVVRALKTYDTAIDKSMLSKMENGVCLPTPKQLNAFAKIYDCTTDDLLNSNLYY